jgi:hypothetical protein
VNHLEAEEI